MGRLHAQSLFCTRISLLHQILNYLFEVRQLSVPVRCLSTIYREFCTEKASQSCCARCPKHWRYGSSKISRCHSECISLKTLEILDPVARMLARSKTRRKGHVANIIGLWMRLDRFKAVGTALDRIMPSPILVISFDH
jgi:hypothetical protein